MNSECETEKKKKNQEEENWSRKKGETISKKNRVKITNTITITHRRCSENQTNNRHKERERDNVCEKPSVWLELKCDCARRKPIAMKWRKKMKNEDDACDESHIKCSTYSKKRRTRTERRIFIEVKAQPFIVFSLMKRGEPKNVEAAQNGKWTQWNMARTSISGGKRKFGASLLLLVLLLLVLVVWVRCYWYCYSILWPYFEFHVGMRRKEFPSFLLLSFSRPTYDIRNMKTQ